jgi:hypothetical protein
MSFVRGIRFIVVLIAYPTEIFRAVLLAQKKGGAVSETECIGYNAED